MLRATMTALLCASASALSVPTVASKPLQHAHFSTTSPSSTTISKLRSSKVQLDLERLKMRTQSEPEPKVLAAERKQSITEFCHNMALQRATLNNANIHFSM